MDMRQPSDQQAIERYRYLLRTAPPETIEQSHAEAFAKLTEQQRRMVLEQLREATPERERGATASSDPQALARMATRAEIRQPGTLERIFGPAGGGGVGGILAGSSSGVWPGPSSRVWWRSTSSPKRRRRRPGSASRAQSMRPNRKGKRTSPTTSTRTQGTTWASRSSRAP